MSVDDVGSRNGWNIVVQRANCFYDLCDHTYYIGGQRVLSVTQALRLAGKIDCRWFTSETCERGLRVHLQCELFDRQKPYVELDGEVAGYRAFVADCQPRWRHVEQPFWHITDAFGGRPDRVAARLFGRPAVVEIKTGGEARWHDLQTAGYQLLIPTGVRFVLYLRPNGTYKLHRCRRSDDYAIFRDCLLQARPLLEKGVLI